MSASARGPGARRRGLLGGNLVVIDMGLESFPPLLFVAQRFSCPLEAAD
jgi:hypothetical protein